MTNYVYRILPHLERDGKVTNRDRGDHPHAPALDELRVRVVMVPARLLSPAKRERGPRAHDPG